jgi:lipid-A-disaccharide synthase
VDHLLAIHAFDVPFFEREGLATTFVSNSALARNVSGADPARLRAAIGAGAEDPILLVLPGSRPSEIRRVMPPFEAAAALLHAQRPGLHIVVPAASTVAETVRAKVAAWPFPAHVIEDETLKFDAMAAATVALACSGTVTTELALAGCPMVVGYRVGEVTYQILRHLVRTRFITLFNIAADAAVAPELIQTECTGPALAAAASARLDDPVLRAAQIAAQNAALEKMGRGGPDPSIKAAEVVVELLGEKARRLT